MRLHPIIRTTAACAAFAVSATAAIPTAAYLFDEAGGTTAADSVRGAAGNASLFNFGGAQWVPGKIGNALEFDGSNDFALALNIAPTGTTAFSVSVWAWADSYPTWGTLVKNWGDGAPGAFHLGFDNVSGRFSNYLWQPIDGPVIDGTVRALNTWHHVVLTYDGASATQKLYVNGGLVGQRLTAPTDLDALTPNMSFGVKTDDSTNNASASAPGYWDGKLDDIVFFGAALTPAEVAQIKTNGDAGISAAVPEPGSATLALAGAATLFIRRRRK